MKHTLWLLTPCVLIAAICWPTGRATVADQPQRSGETGTSEKQTGEKGSSGTAGTNDSHRLTVEAARQRGRMMHAIYASTLDVMHHRYFHGGRSIVPARAMEDIFDDIKDRMSIQARWIAVNLKPMSIHHKPETEFEKRAADKIAGGESEVETIEDGFYRRVGAIAMEGGCISCHDGVFKKKDKQPKFAGLVISIPIVLKPAEGGDEK